MSTIVNMIVNLFNLFFSKKTTTKQTEEFQMSTIVNTTEETIVVNTIPSWEETMWELVHTANPFQGGTRSLEQSDYDLKTQEWFHHELERCVRAAAHRDLDMETSYWVSTLENCINGEYPIEGIIDSLNATEKKEGQAQRAAMLGGHWREGVHSALGGRYLWQSHGAGVLIISGYGDSHMGMGYWEAQRQGYCF